MTTTYSIDDANGTLLCTGLQGELVARRTAERLATERGECVRLYEADADAEDEGGEPAETIDPGRAFVAQDALTVEARVEVDGVAYVVYSDDSYTHAVTEASWDATSADRYDDREGDGYTSWCQDTKAVGDEETAQAILAAAAEQGEDLKVIHLAGTGTPVRAA